MEAKPEARTISVAHSPDSDDAFMFYGLATNKLETDGLKFEHTLKDIQTLNEDAKNGVYDVTAISFHAYAYISDKFNTTKVLKTKLWLKVKLHIKTRAGLST